MFGSMHAWASDAYMCTCIHKYVRDVKYNLELNPFTYQIKCKHQCANFVWFTSIPIIIMYSIVSYEHVYAKNKFGNKLKQQRKDPN